MTESVYDTVIEMLDMSWRVTVERLEQQAEQALKLVSLLAAENAALRGRISGLEHQCAR